jgi:hypothetical protein
VIAAVLAVDSQITHLSIVKHLLKITTEKGKKKESNTRSVALVV